MKIIKHLCLICFSAFIILGCTPNGVSVTDNKKVNSDFSSTIERIKNSIVFIQSSTNKSPKINNEDNSICSGAVIDDVGNILTNFHCIYRAKFIQVFYWDEQDWNPYDVEVIGEDPLADLAILSPIRKDQGKNIPPIPFADIVEVGEEVFALGHPMGLGWTITKGIISNKDRYARHPFIKAVQTDTAINKGNSGGPLLNMRGEIVAINALMISRIQENAGLGISIRYDTVIKSIEKMMKYGKVDRPALGVMIMDLANMGSNEEILKEYPQLKEKYIPTSFGLFVRNSDDIPEDLKAFDTIVAVEDDLVNNSVELINAIDKHNIGDTISLTVIRKRKYIKVQVTLRLFPVPIEQLYPKPGT